MTEPFEKLPAIMVGERCADFILACG